MFNGRPPWLNQWSFAENYCLEGVDYFYYLSQTGCSVVEGIDDVAEWQEMQDGFDTLGTPRELREEVSRVLAAVLWLGNVAFVEDHQVKHAERPTAFLCPYTPYTTRTTPIHT